MYTKFVEILQKKGLTPYQVSKETGISNSSLSDWKNGKSVLKFDKMQQIANCLEIDVRYLLGGDCPYCHLCGLTYLKDDPKDNYEHQIYHEKWEKAVNKFGFCWPYSVRESIKHANMRIIEDASKSTKEHYKAVINILKSYFSRSLYGNDFDLNHPSFNEYVSLLLNQIYWKENIPENAYKQLVFDYSTQEGFPEGTTYDMSKSKSPNYSLKQVELSSFTLPSNTVPNGEIYPVPILGQVKTSVSTIAADNIIGYRFVDLSMVMNVDECFYLYVKGDSMSPKLDENDLVLIRRMPSVDNGSIAVVSVNGEGGIVNKVIYGADSIELHSINPYYPARIFKGKDALEISVIGKVIQAIREF